jgi:hypothetical protein
MSEEILLLVMREEVPNAKNYGGISMFTAINLNIRFIIKMTFVNFVETFI